MKVAIVGLAASTRELAPFTNKEWEIWTLADAPMHIKSLTFWPNRWFEMHRRSVIDKAMTTFDETYRGYWRNPGHINAMRACPCPIYVPDAKEYPEWPTAVSYPIEKVLADSLIPTYMTSSVPYMIALAITERAERIGLYGIEATDELHRDERSCIEFWLGIAIGRGVAIDIPDACPLLKGKLYGYED